MLYDFKHTHVDEFLDNTNNPINGENIKDTWDGNCRVPRDEIQDHHLNKAHRLSWFDELVVFERKLNIDRWTHT